MSQLTIDKVSLEQLFEPLDERQFAEDDGYPGIEIVTEFAESSRLHTCPSLVGYLLKEVAEGRTQFEEGRVLDVAITEFGLLRNLVAQEGGREFTSVKNLRGQSSSYMQIGNVVFSYYSGPHDAPYRRYEESIGEIMAMSRDEDVGSLKTEVFESPEEAQQIYYEMASYIGMHDSIYSAAASQ
ncbi:MAG TPA: hypothetical protein VFW77_01465 [Candidatus Saccharimonadales bacterium]|nr:hypothetical protein [Candidatus Saccharimonadales bacterium]